MSRWGSAKIVPGNGWSQDPKTGPMCYPLLFVAHGSVIEGFDKLKIAIEESFDVRTATTVNTTERYFDSLEKTIAGLLFLKLSEVSLGEDTPERSLEEQCLTLAQTAGFGVILFATSNEQLQETHYLKRYAIRRKAVRMVVVHHHRGHNMTPEPFDPPFHEQFENVRGNLVNSTHLDLQSNYLISQMQRAALDMRIGT